MADGWPPDAMRQRLKSSLSAHYMGCLSADGKPDKERKRWEAYSAVNSLFRAILYIGRSSVGRALQREVILLLNALGRWFESNRPVYQVNMRMNIATCFNKILLEIERKLKGNHDQEGTNQVCSSVHRQHN